MSTTTSKPQNTTPALDPIPSARSNADLKSAIRKLEGMTPNATCALYTSKARVLIVCGPVDPKADFNALCDAADKHFADQDMMTQMRQFADLRGTHLVIDAISQTQPDED